MKLPWQDQKQEGRLAITSSADAFSYAEADKAGRLLRCGHAERGADTPAAFARRIHALALPPRRVCAVLPLNQAQLLLAEAPAVKPEELKAASRWLIKDQVDGRLDDFTIDVMFVGDARSRPARQIFIAAARNTLIRELSERGQAARLEVTVIDLAETTQRNLHSAMAVQEGLGERATAALMIHGDQCLLTLCAAGELYYVRRLDWDRMALPDAQPRPTAPDAAVQPALALEALESMDYIDYGADGETAPSAGGETPRLVIELQRSFDLWERSWPELPLAKLWLQVGEPSARLASRLSALLGQPVGVLDPELVFPGLGAAAPDPALRAAVLPLLGALLRAETRRL